VKKAFTMIEMIFVIVIIGILAAVALPKLAATRDDAEAQICSNEVGQLIHEISNAYTRFGYHSFTHSNVSNMTNIRIIDANDDTRGIKEDTKIDGNGIEYRCAGEKIVSVVGSNAGDEYNLAVTVNEGASNPIAQIAIENVKVNILHGATSKQFTL